MSLTTSLAYVLWVVAGLYVGAPRSHLFPSWISLLMASQKAHPTNQLTSQHLWPFALLCKSLTFSSLLSRLGSIHGANPGSCSFWLTPSFLAPCLWLLMITALHLFTKFSKNKMYPMPEAVSQVRGCWEWNNTIIQHEGSSAFNIGADPL